MTLPVLFAADEGLMGPLLIGFGIIAVLFALMLLIVMAAYGKIWFQAYMSGADVGML